MKKGFTLVELLGVIVVLGIISLIAVPPIINQIRNVRSNISDDTLKLIYSSVNKYMEDNRNTYPIIEDREYCITLETLFNSGKLPNPLLDPYTNREIPETKEVYVKILATNDIEYELVDQGECGYIDPSGASRPILASNMLPVIYDEGSSAWVKADTNSPWYDYNEREWANVVLTTPTSRGYYQNISAGEEVEDEDILAFLVWVPRYRYRLINSNYNDLSEQSHSFDIIFEGPSTSKSAGSNNNDWLTHPAFTFGTEELSGFWIGKYTTGFMDATSASEAIAPSPEVNSAIIKPNTHMWRGIQLANAFVVAREFTDTGNMYGFSSEEVESRLIKNTEWGAVAYLSRSRYGTNEKVWPNINSAFLTGCAGDSGDASASTVCNEYHTENGQNASTTGNIYGVYDMAGGAHEFVMGGTLEEGSSDVRFSNSGFSTGSSNFADNNDINSIDFEHFVNKYEYNDDASNYTHSILGDALGETRGWDGGFSTAAIGSSDNSWYIRGGRNSSNPGASIFSFTANPAGPNTAIGFRIVIHNK